MVVKEPLDVLVEVEEYEFRHLHRHRLPERATVAQCAALTIGFAAYDAAVERHPRDRVILRQGMRIVRDTHPDQRPELPGR